MTICSKIFGTPMLKYVQLFQKCFLLTQIVPLRAKRKPARASSARAGFI